MWVEKHGPKWRIRDRRAGRVLTVQPGYPTKKSAQSALKVLETDRMRGTDLVPRGGQTLLRDWVEMLWPSYQPTLKPSSAASEGARVRNHILPLLGDHTLDELDSVTVQRWVADLLAGKGPPLGERAHVHRRPLSPKSVRNCHGLLHVVLGAAVSQRLLRINPCQQTGLPARTHREMRFLTDPEIGRLLSALPEHWRPMVALLVSTGMRFGEVAGLRVGRVDVLAGRLRVLETLHELPTTAEIVFTTPKTAQSRRTVRFPPEVAQLLVPLVANRDREALVFTAPQGGPVRVRVFRRVWLRAVKAAGLEGVRAHDLRHSYAAAMISAGRPLTAIQRQMGHASIAVTSDLYGHLRDEVDEGMLAVASSMLSLAPDGGRVGAAAYPSTPVDGLT